MVILIKMAVKHIPLLLHSFPAKALNMAKSTPLLTSVIVATLFFKFIFLILPFACILAVYLLPPHFYAPYAVHDLVHISTCWPKLIGTD